MKSNFYAPARVVLLAILLIVSSSIKEVYAQQFLTKIDGWNAYVHLPDEYNDSVGKKYPLIIFISGIGEVGTNPAKLLVYGPSKFIASGASMNFVVNGKIEKPIVISIQPIDPWPPPATLMNKKIDSMVARWRCDPLRISGTGLSMGGATWANYVSYGIPALTNRLASILVMSSGSPETGISTIKNYALGGGKWWGFEGSNDYIGMDRLRDTMNFYKAGSARYFRYIGGHCCWNVQYDPSWNENGESVYTWMLKQRRPSGPNLIPQSNAGNDTAIANVISTYSLKGSGNDPDGNPISFTWRKISGPAGGTIINTTIAQTSVISLSLGVYTFELAVTDALGAISKDTVIINDGNVVLPLTLIDFNAMEKNDHILLQWSTTSEINSSYFEIEKMGVTQQYAKSGIVHAKGAGSYTNKYQFADKFAEVGINYYRLKIVDKDGQFVYSKVIAITVKKLQKGSISILSVRTAAKEVKLSIKSPDAKSANLLITDMQGRLLNTTTISLNKGLNTINIPLSLIRSVYVVKIATNEELRSQLFIQE